MVEPYVVTALSPRNFPIKKSEDSLENLKRISDFMDPAVAVSSMGGPPVRLIVLPEMAIQGMILGFRAGNKEDFARYATSIPGRETEFLGKKARELNAFIAAELLFVTDEDFPGHLFNVAFIVDPKGEIVYRRAKATSDAYEGGMLGTTNPHDLWDEWIEKKGNGNVMDAIFPVAKTELGNIGYCICHEGAYPEISRGLAMNGCEIMIRATLIEPQVTQGMWEISNRAHAMFNQMIVVAPNLGPQIGKDGGSFDLFGGQSMILDHRGQFMARQPGHANGDSFVSATIDIDYLRKARMTNGVVNYFKDLRTEEYAAIYAKPLYPKNQYLATPPTEGWLAREERTRANNIQTLIERGVLTPVS